MKLEAIVQEIQTLSIEERKQLILCIVDSMVVESGKSSPKRSILEFEGIAEHLRDELDAQEHVNQLRSEWDNRP